MYRRLYIWFFICTIQGLFLTQAFAVSPDDLVEDRYVSVVARKSDGTIYRSPTVINAFRKIHPCPSTMLTYGACPNWQINHIVPLACGGKDAVRNMGWFPNDIKTCAGAHCIDRYERKIYAVSPSIPDTANCINQIVP